MYDLWWTMQYWDKIVISAKIADFTILATYGSYVRPINLVRAKHIYIYIRIYMYIHTYIHIYTCIYIYILHVDILLLVFVLGVQQDPSSISGPEAL
jgi:hypothetical protein